MKLCESITPWWVAFNLKQNASPALPESFFGLGPFSPRPYLDVRKELYLPLQLESNDILLLLFSHS